jgi:hypothetical protein
MTGKTLSESIDPIVRVAWILWGAFVLAMVVYAIVPHFLTIEGEAVAGIATIFWLVATALAAAAFLFRRWAFSDDALRKAVGVDDLAGTRMHNGETGRATGPETDATESSAAPHVRTGLHPQASLLGLTPRDRRLVALAQYALRQQIVILALIEAIAVIGFLHAILSRDESLGLPFIAGAVALALLFLPRVREVVERGKAWG